MYPNDFVAAFPYIILTIAVIAIILFDAFARRTSGGLSSFLACASCVAALAAALPSWYLQEQALGGMLVLDPFSLVFALLILGGAFSAILLNYRTLAAQDVAARSDLDALVLLAAMGGLMMCSTRHLIVMFVGLELLSVSVYALSGMARTTKESSEAALKYFLLGAFSSAFLLYGMTLLYAASGSMDLAAISAVGRSGSAPLLFTAGSALLMFGLGFKAALVPFHFWTPDVYQGSPVSVTTFMAVAVKAAAFGALMRVLAIALPQTGWPVLLAVLSGLTMTVGNLLALRQTGLKRLLAYSSISHAGYALLGLVAGAAGGYEATVFYLFVYAVMTIASFGVVLAVTAGTNEQYGNDSVQSLSGLGWRHPVLGLVMTVAVLSLAGIPPLAGFFGKLYLFVAAVRTGWVWLAVIAALNSLISLYYYLGLLVVMYFGSEQPQEKAPLYMTFPSRLALTGATLGTILLGILSPAALRLSQEAARQIDKPPYEQHGEIVSFSR